MTTKTKPKFNLAHRKTATGDVGPGCVQRATEQFRLEVNSCDAYIWVCPEHAEELR